MSDTYLNDPASNPTTIDYPATILDGLGDTAREELDRVLEIGRLLLSVLTQDELNQIEASFKQPPGVAKNR